MKISKKHKNQFLHYRSARNFIINSNLETKILSHIEKPCFLIQKIIKNRGQNGESAHWRQPLNSEIFPGARRPRTPARGVIARGVIRPWGTVGAFWPVLMIF